MKTLVIQLKQAGFFVKPAKLWIFAAFLLCVISLPAIAQKRPTQPTIDSILGIRIGLGLENAHENLERYGGTGGKHDGRKEDEEEEEAGERKEGWSLRSSEYSTIALKADREGKIAWVTGFVRPGREIPFTKLGDLSRALKSNATTAIWNVETRDGGYRVVAKGSDGKARVVYILTLALPPIN